jgi:hypothetical protein
MASGISEAARLDAPMRASARLSGPEIETCKKLRGTEEYNNQGIGLSGFIREVYVNNF